MNYYTTLAKAKAELKATSAGDDSKLLPYIGDVSARIDAEMSNQFPMRPYFLPTSETRKFPIARDRVNSGWANLFMMQRNCLSFSQVLADTTDITSSVVSYPEGRIPFIYLQLTGSRTWYNYCNSSSSPTTYLSVTGIWGFNQDWSNAWLTSTDSITTIGGINSTVTTFTVADTDGANAYGVIPRFSAGNYIRIGTEYMLITATNTTTNTLTVRRGALGTTPIAHAQGAVIDIYQVDDVITRVVARQSALLYSRAGAFQVETLDGVGVVTYPQDLLMELRGVLQIYANRGLGT